MTGTSLPRVPEGLRDLMKVFTKDVLREKPENLYQFSANYFDGIVSEKMPQAMRKYEPVQSYEAIMKNRIRQQVPLSLVFNIIPETLTELIKQFIKAVLKENPENIYVFAREYFNRLSIAKTTQNNRNTNYTTYEKYLEGKENARLAPKVTCECGRVLSAARTLGAIPLSEQNAQPGPLIIDKDNHSHNVNYLRAVCIIQKHFRQYLKRKHANKKYNSHEYVSAIYIIQRQVRRYLTRRRIAKSKSIDHQESKGNTRQQYDSATYMRAVYVIQRHYRLYRKRQNRKQMKNATVSLTAAAFIIQRTFRRLMKARRAKKHTAAALDQGDEVNDNASEAGSYTSASTALLSTESAGEHMEFGGNFEESVHQQTIKEDEEVENDYVNFDETHFEETTKKDGQSINSKKWDSSIAYTGDDDDVEKSRIESDLQETIADGRDIKDFDGNVLLKQNKEKSIDNGIKTKAKNATETEVNEKIIVKREIGQTTAPKENEINEQTSNTVRETIEGEATVSTNDKEKDQKEIIDRELQLEEPAAGEIDQEIETPEDTIQPTNVETPGIKIEPSEDTIKDETDESTVAKMENIVQDAILANMAINKISNDTPIIKLEVTEEKIKDEIDETTVAKEKEDKSQEPSNDKTPIIKIEHTEEKVEDEIDESTIAKMENIVEEAILAKMAINKMSNKEENTHEKVESTEEIQIVVNETTIESPKTETGLDESRIASVAEPSIETEGEHLISKTFEPEEEKTDYIEKTEVEEKAINIKENISDAPCQEKIDEKEIKPAVVKIEDKSNETVKEILENDIISPIIEKINSKHDKPDDVIRIDSEKTDDIDDDKTTEEAKSTILEPECKSDESIIPKTENMSQKEPTVEETGNDLKDLTKPIIEGEEKQVDEPIDIHSESKANELIDESAVNQIKSKDDDLIGESKDVDPTIEIKADTMDKLIVETQIEPVEHITKHMEHKANQLANEAIKGTNDEPEIENLQNIHDQQISKLPKEKHIGSTLESGRLIPAPIAELQLKSFKPPADSAPWYYQPVAEYNDSAESENKKAHTVETSSNDKKIIEEYQNQDIPTNNAIERVPRYFNGDEVPTTKDPKRKNSVAFFISFDSDDEKQTFKVPKKFLKKPTEGDRKTPTNNAIEVDNNDKLEDETYPDLEDELDIEISENDFQQYAVSKLQTIPEVNESDSSNDLRYASKTMDHIAEQSEIEAKEISPLNFTDVKDIDESKVEQITDLKLSEKDPEGNIQNVEEILSNENEKHNAAVIIQNCVRAFLKKQTDNKTNDVVSEFSRKVAAKKIQRAYREFTKRDIQDKTLETNDQHIDGSEDERRAEMIAALIIQKAFRSYSERKKLENYEESSHGSVTSSPMTAIRNLSISSELTSLESSSVLDAAMPLSEDFKDMDSVDGTIVVNEANTDSGVDSETIATARNIESTQVEDTQVDRTHGLLESKFVPDTCNSLIDQNQTPRALEQTNAVSNDLAVSTDGAVFGLVEDTTLGPLDHSGSFAGGTAAIRELVNDFLINEIQYSTQEQSQPTEVHEEPCIKKTASITNLNESLESIKSPDTKQSESPDVILGENLTHGESMDLDTFATDTLDKATLKLLKPERTIEKMSQRQISESLDKDILPTEASFEEPIIKSMGSLHDQANMDIEDGDLIIYKRLQREDTRESSAQSDSVVFGETNDEEAERQGSASKIDAETTRVQFTRHYTIAGDDPRRMFKTIDDDFEAAPLIDSTSSFCLDDETSEAIRKKIMAYSLSETDSDYFDPNKVITDDSYIDTAMADDAMGTSTETESTIVSAATKIQAGARGFLTRRRLRRASAGTKSSTQETKASFGNDAISESLERFIEEEAAKKIQAAYRIHTRKQNRRKNKLEGASLESSLAARRQKLQRGDALRNDSTPDDDNSARTSINTTNGPQVEKLSKKHRSEATAEEHKKSKINMELKWPVLRQNSMPVQIDCEVLRVIPKHLRKRIKSAESQKKNRK
ncbi:microtubule-associated protein futsch [Drosophila tropicalis]|uniref:microtubule-associated protein futsch n=1 Tax=Drosophila tropicalis TaxID=46794 RepID=UPI0035AC21B2